MVTSNSISDKLAKSQRAGCLVIPNQPGTSGAMINMLTRTLKAALKARSILPQIMQKRGLLRSAGDTERGTKFFGNSRRSDQVMAEQLPVTL